MSPLRIKKWPPGGETSYASVSGTEPFEDVVARMSEEKAKVVRRHLALLGERYDLSDRPTNDLVMSGGKSVQGGIRVKLPEGVSWDELG
ncbi:cytochrome B6, partial [bacterium]|nr:cytochrome B6 [bacterium]